MIIDPDGDSSYRTNLQQAQNEARESRKLIFELLDIPNHFGIEVDVYGVYWNPKFARRY